MADGSRREYKQVIFEVHRFAVSWERPAETEPAPINLRTV